MKTTATVWTNPIHFLACGCGSGLLPKIPGTWGTLASVPLYLILAKLPLWGYLAALAVLIGAAIWICDRTEADFGVTDHSAIVLDETVGFLLTMAGAPLGWEWVVLGFVLFRIFDMWKPWPIRWFDQHVKGGLGIVLDDVIAAVPAWLLLQLISTLAISHYS